MEGLRKVHVRRYYHFFTFLILPLRFSIFLLASFCWQGPFNSHSLSSWAYSNWKWHWRPWIVICLWLNHLLLLPLLVLILVIRLIIPLLVTNLAESKLLRIVVTVPASLSSCTPPLKTSDLTWAPDFSRELLLPSQPLGQNNNQARATPLANN